MANWANLTRDCLITIAERLKLMEDYSCFGAVCKAWQAVATQEKFKGIPLWQGRPCLMLAENEDNYYRELYSLFEDKVVTKIFFPTAKKKRCMEASFGWLLTIESKDGNTSLLNPFNGDQMQLPHPNSTEDFSIHQVYYPIFFRKALLSSAPCQNSQDFVLMVIEAGMCFLSFWRPGDRFWTRISSYYGSHADLVYYKGKFYAITDNGKIVVCDVDGPHPKKTQIVAQLPSDLPIGFEPYIVESMGKLLVVARYGIQFSGLDTRPEGYTYYESFYDFEIAEESDADEGGSELDEEGSADEDGGAADEGGGELDGEGSVDEDGDAADEGGGELDEEGSADEDGGAADVGGDELDESAADEGGRELIVYGTYRFRVLEVDLIHGKCIEIDDIGDRAIFLGHSTSVCIDQASKFPEIKANHIYFTDDYPVSYIDVHGGGGRDMGLYNVKDRSITKHYKGESLSIISPPVWIMPCSSCMSACKS